MAPGSAVVRLQRAQEVQQVLLLSFAQGAEVIDHPVGLGWLEPGVARALVSQDGLHEVAGAAVVQEEEPLAETPQRRGAELVALGGPLQDVVREARSHAMQEQ